MFIPLEKKPDWRHPPFITLSLILLNLLCFVFWQQSDDLLEENTRTYYFSSGLADVELPAYMIYLKNNARLPFATSNYSLLNQNEKLHLYQQLLVDGGFQKTQKLKLENPDLALWQTYRLKFDNHLKRVTRYNYGFQPAFPDIKKAISSLFLHADYMHLLGNMFFLFLFGFVLELAVGRIVLLASFFASGIAANFITAILEPANAQWLIGTSGAITALAGIYIMLFGMQKLRFFYTIIFYFDYIKAPAFIMLPVWVIYEVIYAIIDPGSVNTVTHLSGLAIGLIIGIFCRKFLPRTVTETQSKTHTEDFKSRFQQGMTYLSKTEFEKARELFESIQEQHPDDINVIKQLFFIAKIQSNMGSMKTYASQLLELPVTDTTDLQTQNQIFNEYFLIRNKKPDLPVQTIAKSCLRLCSTGHIKQAEEIINYLVRTNPEYPKMPKLLLAIITNLNKRNSLNKDHSFLDILLTQYSNSEEAAIVRKTIAN